MVNSADWDRLSKLSEYCGGDVLDIGCDAGLLKQIIGERCVNVDISATKAVDIIADGHYLPFKNSTFDVVVCNEVLEHVISPLQLLKEANRVSRSRLILSVPNPYCYKQIFSMARNNYNLKEFLHLSMFGKNEIDQLLSLSGWKVIRSYYDPNDHWMAGWWYVCIAEKG